MSKGTYFLRRGIDAHGARHLGIRVLPRLHAPCGMQVQRDLQSFLVQVPEERLGIRKQQTIPAITCPALGVSRLIFLLRKPAQAERLVPLHIDDQHVERHVVLVKTVHEFVEFLVGVGPITRPPRAEGEARRQRNGPGDLDEVGERLLVVVAIGEEVPVLALARRPLQDPRPRAVLALKKPEVGRVEERPRGVIYQHPSVARDQAWIHRLFRLAAERAVERARRALQIAGVGHAGPPGEILARGETHCGKCDPIQGEGDGEVVRVEHSICTLSGRVAQSERPRMQRRDTAILLHGEVRYRQIAIQKHQRRVIFELAVGRPLHANELRSQNGESSVTHANDGLGIRDGIVEIWRMPGVRCALGIVLRDKQAGQSRKKSKKNERRPAQR